MSRTYADFIAAKALIAAPIGIEHPPDLGVHLFPFQRDIVRWALRRGRAAIFADCGMGKTAMQIEWARVVAERGRVLILAPLAVATQTEREATKFGCIGVSGSCLVKYLRADDGTTPIVVTNYEMLDHFNPVDFIGVVLDESSILKAHDGKTRTRILEAFRSTPFRLACTATPAPNDFIELGNHVEFLGVMSQPEMRATFFVHDGGTTQDWRLKGHAERAFWRWLCSFCAMVRRPSDLGYSDDGFVLPELVMHSHVAAADYSVTSTSLIPMAAVTLAEQRVARRESLAARVALAAEIANRATDEPVLVWCELNAEGDALTAAIPGAVQVSGADDQDAKERAMLGFARGEIRVLVTKPSVAGFGLNWQHCARMIFVGLSHSYEQFYQAVRRCWRFGQTRVVNCHVVTGELEGRILDNIRRKDADAQRMIGAMLDHMREIQNTEIRATARDVTEYRPAKPMKLPKWLTPDANID